MPTRVAKTEWSGGLQDVSGRPELLCSGLGSYEVSFLKRAAEEGGGATSPEELIAAALSACYAMQLSALLAKGTRAARRTRRDRPLVRADPPV